jgi:diguanylate cyclase (GGDEF)-like protein
VLITSTLFVVLYLAVAMTSARIHEPEDSVGRLLLVVVFGGIALVMAARVGLVFSGLRSGAPPGFTSPVRALMFIIASSGPVAGSFAFVLTCGERIGARLLHEGLTDPLTGVPNRRAFLDSLVQALSLGRRRAEPVAVLVVDVDHFKHVNDSAGHAAGDQILVAVAQLLSSKLRAGDRLGRLGGEEFGVVVQGAGPTLVAERLREAIAAHPVAVEGRSFQMTVSIGVVASASCEEDPRSLLARADELMYEAKGRGRNQVICAEPGVATPAYGRA